MNKFLMVRKHGAPNGALRPTRSVIAGDRESQVRKHQAPKGALRRNFAALVSTDVVVSESTERHKAH